jgi:hypothetical protein
MPVVLLALQQFLCFGSARSRAITQSASGCRAVEQLLKEVLMIADGASAQSAFCGKSNQVRSLAGLFAGVESGRAIFQELRRRMLFRIFDSIKEIEECLSEVQKEFYWDAAQVKSLTLHLYITYARSI